MGYINSWGVETVIQRREEEQGVSGSLPASSVGFLKGYTLACMLSLTGNLFGYIF